MQALTHICNNGVERVIFSALMLWMFFAAFRVSELLGLRAGEGLDWGGCGVAGRGVVIQVRKSKTDQRAEGKEVRLPRFTRQGFFPLYWGQKLRAWAQGARLLGIRVGPQ